MQHRVMPSREKYAGWQWCAPSEWKKPILALYRKQEGKNLSAMIGGSEYIQVVNYIDSVDAEAYIDKFLDSLA